MKNFKLGLLFCMSLVVSLASAQTYDVTFSVDMAGYTGAFTTPTVNGSFAGWCGDCAPMTNTAGTIWEATVNVAAGVHDYKFAHDNWTGEENLLGLTGCPINTDGASFANRQIDAQADVTLPTVCWEECVDCATAASAGCTDSAAQNYDAAAGSDNGTCEYLLTLTVDMSNEASSGPVNSVFGSFNGWTPGATLLTDNGDGTWSVTITVQNGAYEYKFHNDGVGALGEEIFVGGESCTITTGAFTNRLVNVTADTTVGAVCWTACVDCAAANMSGCTDIDASNYNAAATTDDGTCTYFLNLTVDMSSLGAIGPVNSVFGSFNGWTPGASVLSDNGDGTWSIALEVANGNYEYKFHNDGAGAIGEEIFAGGESCTLTSGPFTNRAVTVSGNTTVSVVCWESCDACAPPVADVRITSVDPTTGEITLTNLGAADQDISTWQVCNFPPYASVTSLGAPSNLAAGASATFTWAAAIDADGELGLYTIGGGFGSSANIADYVEWASTGHTRSAVAVAAGVWNTGDFVDGPAPYTFIGTSGDYGSAFWDVNNPTYDVTFVMDLSNETVNALGVNIAGTFNGFDANGGLMTNNGDGTFSYTVNAEEGSVIEFTYINGNNFIDQETVPSECGVDNGFGGFNRIHTVGSADETLPTVCFSSCVACATIVDCDDVNAANYDPAATSNTACTYNTTFTVDMSEYVPAFTILNVSGEWNGFCLDCNQLSDNGDGTWSGTFAIPSGDYAYKFQVDSFADQEILVAGPGSACFVSIGGFTNRVTTVEQVVSNDIPVVCWASCQACADGGTPGCTDASATNYDMAADEADGSCIYNVTFQVDMSQVADPFTTPEVNATFNGFCGDCNPMIDQGAGIWVVTLPLQEGYYEFKYTADGFAIQEDLSSEAVGLTSCVTENFGFFNRYVNVSGDTTLDLSCYGSCAECPAAIPGCTDMGAQNYNAAAQTDDGSCTYLLTVTVNMSQVIDPFTQPTINGAFNGWCGNCNPLTDNGDGTWSTTITVLNGDQLYKFAADDWNIEEDLAGVTGCTSFDGTFTNRIVNITGDTTLPAVCWASCDDCEALGCTDPLFLEFDPYATTDDGSCSVLIVEGCAYPDADNFDPAANTDDGSCMFTTGAACPGDFNDDGFVNVSDLGGFLGAFGSACE